MSRKERLVAALLLAVAVAGGALIPRLLASPPTSLGIALGPGPSRSVVQAPAIPQRATQRAAPAHDFAAFSTGAGRPDRAGDSGHHRAPEARPRASRGRSTPPLPPPAPPTKTTRRPVPMAPPAPAAARLPTPVLPDTTRRRASRGCRPATRRRRGASRRRRRATRRLRAARKARRPGTRRRRRAMPKPKGTTMCQHQGMAKGLRKLRPTPWALTIAVWDIWRRLPPPSAASSSCSPEGTAQSWRAARQRRPRTAAATSSARPARPREG